jgi:hypothetical protein
MESAAVPASEAAPSTTPVPSSGEKGLKKNAIGFASSVVIGMASTAPGYSRLAATLGFVTAAVGLASPAILLVSSIPMLPRTRRADGQIAIVSNNRISGMRR